MLLLIISLEPPESKFRALWFFWIIQMMLNQAANLRRKETEKEKGGGGRIRKEGRKGERDKSVSKSGCEDLARTGWSQASQVAQL